MSQQPSLKWLIGKVVYLVFFWIVAIIVVLYVAGFRVNLNSHRVSSFSSVSFASYQNKRLPVTYTINGEERQGNFPLVINWLTPGNYNVSVKTADTLPWYRTFRLEANGAYTFENILLVPQNLAERAVTSNEQATLDRVDKYVSTGLIIRGTELFDARANEQKLIVRMSSPIEQAIWYPKRTHVIVRSNQTLYIMEATGTNITSLQAVTSLSPIKVVVTSDGSTILVQDGDHAYALDLFK